MAAVVLPVRQPASRNRADVGLFEAEGRGLDVGRGLGDRGVGVDPGEGLVEVLLALSMALTWSSAVIDASTVVVVPAVPGTAVAAVLAAVIASASRLAERSTLAWAASSSWASVCSCPTVSWFSVKIRP